MDFNDNEHEAAYRAEAKAWLAKNAPLYVAPEGAEPHEAFMRRARGWQACKAGAGRVGIAWPNEAGGQGGTPMQHVIFHQEEEHFALPVVPFHVGMGMCLPTLFTHGSKEVIERHMAPAMRGDELWCQLFSEPSAGSDLAAVRTRALKEGDTWVINGQKVWTSFAHEADFGILLARTDSSAPKHKGLTMFYIDMHAPGIEVRPIRTLLGDPEFNEVFLTDLRIPDSQRLGATGNGWKVSLTTLLFERLAVGGKPAGAPGVRDLLKLIAQPDPDDTAGDRLASIADSLARFYVADEGIALTRLRSMTAVSRGEVPGPEASINKLVMAKTLQDMSAYAQELLAERALEQRSDDLGQRFNYWHMWSAGLRIAGGTDEILRNVIAERVLGLPPEPRNDRDTPFNQLNA